MTINESILAGILAVTGFHAFFYLHLHNNALLTKGEIKAIAVFFTLTGWGLLFCAVTGEFNITAYEITLLYCMICISTVDAMIYKIPSGLVYYLAGVEILIFFNLKSDISSMLLSVTFITFVFMFIYYLPFIFFHKFMLGFGDVKLVAALGILIPLDSLPDFMLSSSLAGFTFMLISFLVEKQSIKKIPFAPCLCFAALLFKINNS